MTVLKSWICVLSDIQSSLRQKQVVAPELGNPIRSRHFLYRIYPELLLHQNWLPSTTNFAHYYPPHKTDTIQCHPKSPLRFNLLSPEISKRKSHEQDTKTLENIYLSTNDHFIIAVLRAPEPIRDGFSWWETTNPACQVDCNWSVNTRKPFSYKVS